MKNPEAKARRLIRSAVEAAEGSANMPAFLRSILRIVDPEDLLDASPDMPEYLREYLAEYEDDLEEEEKQAILPLLR